MKLAIVKVQALKASLRFLVDSERRIFDKVLVEIDSLFDSHTRSEQFLRLLLTGRTEDLKKFDLSWGVCPESVRRLIEEMILGLYKAALVHSLELLRSGGEKALVEEIESIDF